MGLSESDAVVIGSLLSSVENTQASNTGFDPLPAIQPLNIFAIVCL
jgi:hypothetical protein